MLANADYIAPLSRNPLRIIVFFLHLAMFLHVSYNPTQSGRCVHTRLEHFKYSRIGQIPTEGEIFQHVCDRVVGKINQ